jgi:hypothetical protein
VVMRANCAVRGRSPKLTNSICVIISATARVLDVERHRMGSGVSVL